MSNKYWICRHGKTEWNNKKIRQGHRDSPLTEEGIQQANMLGLFFRNIEGELYSSPLGRALHTSKIIVKKNNKLSLHIDERLKEISFGILEGKSKINLDANHRNILIEFQRNPFDFSFPSGESYTDLFSRAKSFINELPLTKNDIIIIGHEDINKMILMKLLKIPKMNAINIIQPNNIVYKICCEKVMNIDLYSGIEKTGLLMRMDSE